MPPLDALRPGLTVRIHQALRPPRGLTVPRAGRLVMRLVGSAACSVECPDGTTRVLHAEDLEPAFAPGGRLDGAADGGRPLPF